MDIVKEYNVLEGKYIAFGKIFNNYKQLLKRLGFKTIDIDWALSNLMLFKDHNFTLNVINFLLEESEKYLESLKSEKLQKSNGNINSYPDFDIDEEIKKVEYDIAELELYQSGYLINDYEDTLYDLYEYFSINYHKLLKETMGIDFYSLFKNNLKSENSYYNWSELLKILKQTIKRQVLDNPEKLVLVPKNNHNN